MECLLGMGGSLTYAHLDENERTQGRGQSGSSDTSSPLGYAFAFLMSKTLRQ